jgi:hypothetical protein
MALSPRERLIALATGAAAVIFVGNKYAYEPYVQARADVARERAAASDKLDQNTRLLTRKKRLENEERAWKQRAGPLPTDPAEAERQLLAVRDWAQEAGLTNISTTPRREPRNDRTQIVRLDASANGSLAAVAKLLWRVESATPALKVDELALRSRSDGADDLQVDFKVSTIWLSSAEPATGTGARPATPGGSSDAAPGASRRPARREDL